MYRLKNVTALIAIVGCLIYAYAQAPLWQNLYPSYSGLTFGDDKFVAVSLDGVIKTSPNGMEWSQKFIPAGNGGGTLYSVAYGNDMFLVTQSGSDILRSADAEGWDWISTSINVPCRFLTFGDAPHWGKFFVGVGDGGMTFVYDGQFWDEGDGASITTLSHVAFGAGRFVAVGSGIMVSPSGEEWAAANISGGIISGGIGAVAFGNSGFVAISANGTTLYTSPNGSRDGWTSSSATPALPAGVRDMTFGDNKFVAVFNNGKIAMSDDGSQWTVSEAGDDNLIAVKFGNGVFTALGAHGSIYTSTNGVSWENAVSGNSRISDRQIVHGGTRFVAIGDSGVSVSDDGKNWRRHVSETQMVGLRAVAYGEGKFVTVGDSGAIFSSTDGNVWDSHSHSNRNVMFTSIAYGGGRFIAGGVERWSSSPANITMHMFSSVNGQTWNDVPGINTQWANIHSTAMAFGNNRFVAASTAQGSGMLKHSEKGEFWADVALPSQVQVTAIASLTYVNDKFVALGITRDATLVLESTDGITFSPLPPSPAGVKSAIFSKEFYVLAADSGNIFASQSGNEWILQQKATNRHLQTIYSDGNILLAAGNGGVMLYSDQIPSLVSVRHTQAARRVLAGGRMNIETTSKTTAVTLSFTPEKPGTMAIYSLTGRQLYKRNMSAGERVVNLPTRRMPGGTVIVRYIGDDRVITQRFQLMR